MNNRNEPTPRSLLAEEPLKITTDPLTGRSIRCIDLQREAQACFRRAHAMRPELRDERDLAATRELFGPCWLQARQVVRECRLPIGIGPPRRRR